MGAAMTEWSGSAWAVGYRAQNVRAEALLPVLPLVVAISFLLIADIDSPRGGLRAPDAKP